MKIEAATFNVLKNTEMAIDNAEPPLKLFDVSVAIEKDVTGVIEIDRLKDEVAQTRMLLEGYCIEL